MESHENDKIGLTEETGQASRHLKEREKKKKNLCKYQKFKKTKNNKSTSQLTKYLLSSERVPSIVL